jgi:hypothetical protein
MTLRLGIASPLLSAALVLVLAACSSNQNPLKITRTDCPAVSIVKNANVLTRFQGFGRDTQDVLWVANLDGLVDRCNEAKGPITNQISVRVGIQRAEAGPPESVVVPVFIAVVRDSKTLITKDIKQVTVNFADKSLRGAATQSFTTAISDREKAKTGKYEVVVGFQLNDDEALFNILR